MSHVKNIIKSKRKVTNLIKMSLLKYIGILLCFNAVFCQYSNVNDYCRTNEGIYGICKAHYDCPEAINAYKSTGIRPTLCGFEGSVAVLCCSENIENNNENQDSAGQESSDPDGSNTVNNDRISQTMCTRYSKSVTEDFHALPLLPNASPITITVPKCTHNSSPLIVGGVETAVGEFPHQAAIGFEDPNINDSGYTFICGGTLISDEYVVTAAHCTFHRSLSAPKIVRLGEYNIDRTDDGVDPEDYQIRDIILHPEYKPPSKYHDIALLRLKPRVKFSDTIRPACLWQRNDFGQERNATATGWGQLSQRSSQRPSVLQKVNLGIIDHQTCKSLPGFERTKAIRRGIIQEQVCAGDLVNGGKDTCQGDSGGPLTISDRENRCIFYLIGITSFGTGCGYAQTPGVYTRVSSYINWIEDIVWSKNK